MQAIYPSSDIITCGEYTPQDIENSAVGRFIPEGYTDQRMATVGQNLTALRKRLGVKQYVLAERLGMTQGSLSKFEHAEGLPESGTLLKLAKALPCAVEDLLVGVDPDYDVIRKSRIDLIRPSGTDDVSSGSKSRTGGRSDGSPANRLLEEVVVGYAQFRKQVAKLARTLGTAANELAQLAESQPALVKAGRPRKSRSAPRRRGGAAD